MKRSGFLLILALVISLGHSAEVRINGLRTITEQEALDFLGGRLTYIKTRPANASRADDVAFMLENLLSRRGFNDAKVSWSLQGSNTIILSVNEGTPYLLGEISVSGLENEETKQQVINQFREAHNSEGALTSATPYLPSQNNTGLLKASQYLQSLGYWDAEVTLTGTNRNSQTRNIDAKLLAKPGTEYTLSQAIVIADGVRQTLIEQRLSSLVDQVASTENVRKARNHVEEHYRNNGYQLAKVAMSPTQDNGRFALSFDVEPGRRYSVGEITITGEEDVDEKEIRRRFRNFRRKEYNARDIEKEISKLYGTGAFESINMETFPQDNGTIDLDIKVKESKPDGYYAYAGAGSLEGFIFGGGYYHRNLFGNLWNFSSALEISGIGLLGDVRVTDPYFLGHDLSFTTRLYALTRDYDGYKKQEIGAGAEVSWKVEDKEYAGKFSFYSSFTSSEADGVADDALGPDNYFLHRLALEQVVDQRNNVTLPTNGYYLRLNNELGLTFGDDSVSYFRTDAQLSIYQPVFETSYLAFNTQAGLIIPTGDSENFPIDLRYFLGGASSVRSFPERELGPQSNDHPRGGEAYWIANFEYIQQIKSLLSGVVFMDAGNLNENFEDFGSGRTNYAAGVGLRLDLPIGPVRFEYGRNLNPSQGDPSGAFHFAIGTTF